MPPSRIAKNTAYLTMAFTAQKILSFAYFAFIARFIGNDDSGIGKYVFALSFTAIFGMFIDFGMHPVLIREIARDKSKIAALLSTILTSKIIFEVKIVERNAAIFDLSLAISRIRTGCIPKSINIPNIAVKESANTYLPIPASSLPINLAINAKYAKDKIFCAVKAIVR